MNEKLNIQNLVDLLAEKHGMSKKNADSFVKEFFLLIEESLKKDKYVKIKGLGTFKLIDIDSRESVNVNTGERFEIQGHTKVSFTPEPSLKDVINRPFAHFETVALNADTVLEGTPMEGDDDESPSESESVPETVEELKTVEIKEVQSVIVEPMLHEEAIDTKTIAKIVTPPIEQVVLTARQEAVMRAKASALTTEVIAGYTQKESVAASLIKTQRDASAMKYFIGVVALVVILCVGALAFMYYPDLLNNSTSEVSTKKMAEVAKPLVKEVITPKDTIRPLSKDTVVVTSATISSPKVVEEKITPLPKKEPLLELAKPSAIASLEYTIAGTQAEYTVLENETLSKIAFKFYGTKKLWPYIVKHNPKAIKNPDNVPFGTVIKIPKLVKKQ